MWSLYKYFFPDYTQTNTNKNQVHGLLHLRLALAKGKATPIRLLTQIVQGEMRRG